MTTEHLGELAAFGTTISWTIGIFPFTQAAVRMGPNPVNHFRLLLAVLFLTVITLLVYGISLPQLFRLTDTSDWIWFGLSGIIGLSLGDYFGFYAMAILGARRTTIFNTLAPAAVMITAFFVIHERINIIGVTGILITISGIVLLTLSKKEKENVPRSEYGSYGYGVFCGLMSATCQGLGIVLANKGFLESGEVKPAAFHACWIRMMIGTGAIFLFTIARGRLAETARPVLTNKNNGIPYMIAGTIFGPVVGVSLSMLAISLLKDEPSVAQTILSLMPIFTLPVAAIMLKEKISLTAVLAVLVAVGGVMVLIQKDDIARALFGH
jgi:drug/metabolite transporter (DMT)-like permease